MKMDMIPLLRMRFFSYDNFSVYCLTYYSVNCIFIKFWISNPWKFHFSRKVAQEDWTWQLCCLVSSAHLILNSTFWDSIVKKREKFKSSFKIRPSFEVKMWLCLGETRTYTNLGTEAYPGRLNLGLPWAIFLELL